MFDEPCTWTAQRRLPSEFGVAEALLGEVTSALVRHRWHKRDRFCVRLALEEAIVNAVKHGNRLDSSKWVDVDCKLFSGLFLAEVADQGEGFDLHSVPDPTQPEFIKRPVGRGLLLMRSFMTGVEFNDRGNRVRMWKVRDAKSLQDVDEGS